MNVELFRNYCLSKKGATEDFPFDENTAVYKVMGKIFALGDVQDFVGVNLKVEPESGAELRERYPAVNEGYHMNKKHWITVAIDGTVSDRLIYQWVDNSYDLVVDRLTKTQKSALETK